MSQKATLKAIEDGDGELKKSMQELVERKTLAIKHLSQIDGVKASSPDGAFYIWLDVRGLLGKKLNSLQLMTSSDLSAGLLDTQKVAVVPGIEFGLDGYVRLSFALKSDRMIQAFERIKTFAQSLES
jgi:aspartate aminotransferase